MRLEGHIALPDAPASQEPREIELAVRCEVVAEPGVAAVSWGAITAVGTVDPAPVAADRALGAHHWARCAVVARIDHVCPAAVRRRNACDFSRAIELGASCYLRPADGDEGTWESAPPRSCGDLRSLGVDPTAVVLGERLRRAESRPTHSAPTTKDAPGA